MGKETVSRTKVKERIKAIQEVKQANHEAEGAMQGLPGELASVGNLVGKEESTTIGKKLIRVGTFLIVAMPEPFVTDIAGTALVATGFALNRFTRRKNVRDYYRKFQEDMRQIELIRREISTATSN